MYMTVPGSGKASVLFLNKVDDHQRVLHRRPARSELHFNRVVLCVVTQAGCDGVRWGEEGRRGGAFRRRPGERGPACTATEAAAAETRCGFGCFEGRADRLLIVGWGESRFL